MKWIVTYAPVVIRCFAYTSKANISAPTEFTLHNLLKQCYLCSELLVQVQTLPQEQLYCKLLVTHQIFLRPHTAFFELSCKGAYIVLVTKLLVIILSMQRVATMFTLLST